jgi:subtilisin family serine protease
MSKMILGAGSILVSIMAFPAQAADKSALPTFATLNTARPANLYSWMSPEIGNAWRSGFRGQGTTITVVDDFRSANINRGNLGTGVQNLRHGEWTRLQAGMIAPSAALASHDFYPARAVPLATRGLNVLNLSYGMYAAAGYSANQIGWSAQESSIISYSNGRAFIAKAAGNDGVNIGAANGRGQVDYLNVALTGKTSAIFVGALDRNGTPTQKASLASYSNKAGSQSAVQSRFLSVGVRGDVTGLYGTSFAAPIVSGYASVLGSKFTSANGTQIANQLLATARRDTILNYNVAIHGRGEASISRALAPVSIR